MKKILKIFVIILVLGAVGFGVYYFLQKRSERIVVQEPGEQEVVEEPYVDPFPNDQDRDGLTDEQEAELGTSDYEYDTDGDGLSDVDEINYWKTDPLNPDTDGDGFADAWEILGGYNPNGAGTL